MEENGALTYSFISKVSMVELLGTKDQMILIWPEASFSLERNSTLTLYLAGKRQNLKTQPRRLEMMVRGKYSLSWNPRRWVFF